MFIIFINRDRSPSNMSMASNPKYTTSQKVNHNIRKTQGFNSAKIISDHKLLKKIKIIGTLSPFILKV